MIPAIEFLERHLPARAPAWELAALEALAGAPRSLLPWPWVDMRLVPEPDLPQPQDIIRIEADLGLLTLPPQGATLMRFRVCADLAWVGMLIPEREAYSLIVEGFALMKRLEPIASASDPDATQEARRAHMPNLPLTPSPGYAFADPTAPDWDGPLDEGDTVTIAFKNTSDQTVQCRIRGSALVFRTQPK